jgi:putative transferase (TIGR04331 family)
MSARTGSFNRVFLATTGLEKFWDTGRPIVFLGPWCFVYERSAQRHALGDNFIESPYKNSAAAEKAYFRVTDLCDRIVPLLAEKLNGIHGVEYSNRFWQITLGPWLQLYLSATYDRYLHICSAKEQFPDFETMGLAQDSFVIPADTMQLVELLKGDFYNLQLYTKVLKFLGIQFSTEPECSGVSWVNASYSTRQTLVQSAEKSINWLVNLLTVPGLSVHLQASYFTKRALRRLVLRHIGNAWPRSSGIKRCNWEKLSTRCRIGLGHIPLGEDEFEKFLSQHLLEDIPQCYVEGFGELCREVKNKYWKMPKAIFSSNSWYYDEHFKQWAASSSEQGSILLGTQHGGCYGVLKHKLAEDHETAVVDYFYSWGWQREGCKAEVIAMPATNFVGITKLGADKSRSGILWVTSAEPRYLMEMPRLPVNFEEYLAWQLRFLQSMPTELLGELRLRPHYEDHGWGIVARLKSQSPELQIDSWSTSFWDSLANCRIYVCDHLSTTYAQALAANKPTLLFFNEKFTTEISPAAQPYFSMLRLAGVLHADPESAAAALALIYEDIETWWYEPSRQIAIATFCRHFALTSPNALDLWDYELERVLSL